MIKLWIIVVAMTSVVSVSEPFEGSHSECIAYTAQENQKIVKVLQNPVDKITGIPFDKETLSLLRNTRFVCVESVDKPKLKD